MIALAIVFRSLCIEDPAGAAPVAFTGLETPAYAIARSLVPPTSTWPSGASMRSGGLGAAPPDIARRSRPPRCRTRSSLRTRQHQAAVASATVPAAGAGSGAASMIDYLSGRRPESSQADGFNSAAMTWIEGGNRSPQWLRRPACSSRPSAQGATPAEGAAPRHRTGVKGTAPLRRHRRRVEPRAARSTRASMVSTPRSYPLRRPSTVAVVMRRAVLGTAGAKRSVKLVFSLTILNS